MKRIFVPTDFSPNAECALAIAVDIATKIKGSVILYHVYVPIDSPMIGDAADRKQHNMKTESIILKRLQRLKKKALKNAGDVPVATLIGRAPLIKNILTATEKNRADLIIMGTKGAGRIKKILIGSVASKISRKSTVPVMLVPEKYERASFDRVVLASDYHASDEYAINLGLSFANLFSGSLTVVHLLSADTPEKKRQKEKNEFETYAYYMQRKFDTDRLKFQLLETPTENKKMETLQNLITYNLLVMVRRKRSFFQRHFSESFTNAMSFISKKPLLIIPPEV